MKKFLGVLLIVSMIFTLAACAASNKGTETNKEGETTPSKEETNATAGLMNPWVDSDKAGVLEATGFNLVAPEGATNVIYSYMPSTGMAQMDYNIDNAKWVYRAQPADLLEDISGIYSDWNYTGENKVSGMDAIEYSYASEAKGDSTNDRECVRVINWYDAQKKVTYSLAALGPDLNGMDIAAYAELLYNASAKEKVSMPLESFLGLHVSSYDGSDINVEKDSSNGKLKVNVSLFRLCTLDDGVGVYENGSIIFDSKDPSGNPIKCCLYYNSDNSLCMEVTESTWTYLTVGTVVEGFDK